jgi:TrmH family RNA methyltransferase
MREHTVDELLLPDPGLIIIAHELQDPGNLGSIIRTAEAVGASGLAISPHTVDPYSSKAVRASMGSILRVPVVRIADITSFIRLCRQSGFQTAATLLTGDTSHFDADLRRPTAVIIGQEGGGLPKDIADHIDVRVRIPMYETIDSLNVATATAVFLYETLRQRTRKKPAL